MNEDIRRLFVISRDNIADVFTQGEMYEIVESYNQNIENDIAAFVST